MVKKKFGHREYCKQKKENMFMFINGRNFSLENLKNNKIKNILEHFNLKEEMVAIELNHKILPKENWNSTLIGDNDNIEIIKLVGGG